jgi:hypothetical protein
VPVLFFKEVIDFNIGDNEVKMLGWRFSVSALSGDEE